MQEVDVAIVADVGTLQRLPRIVGQGKTCYHIVGVLALNLFVQRP